MKRQKTIKSSVEYQGIGLHSGQKVLLRLIPAPSNTGIIFKRIEKESCKLIRATISNVVKSDREVILRENNTEIRTVEHLLAALAGCNVTNIYIELNNGEIPIGDGSSKIYIDLIKEAKVVEQGEKEEVIKIDHPLYAVEDDSQIIVLPNDELKISYLVKFNHQVVDLQYASFKINEEIFIKEIAPARTFGFLSEVESLRKKGLIKGGSLENAVVISEDKILNDHLRFEDELVRHKILDLMGDISLVGCPVVGHFIALKSGHSLNIKLAKKIVDSYKNKG
ncbi:UDP-3-O-acyl-N-acetylglucosamine deacetylase [bacterium]|nr:UDP-3-O-acyl-N-acetylglucosamine deacetylase [bacterium]MBU0900198.1 UDP-3-O-acyl-N-acetylglucosamine deacetylase [bacterium]MBU1154031.1 UDP-3-O-acyl-N-acetylglucosamine deacetylase [bacterium]MBU1782174.1 UDP-3-O-acyl-N-acetylglucosamine deacetylase [bacterium]